MTQPGGSHPRELLSAYLDGELDATARSAVEEHVSACPGCRTLLQDFRSMATAAMREAAPPVTAGLHGRIRRALESEAIQRRSIRGAWFRPYRLGLAAAAGVVLVIGLWVLRHEPAAPEWPRPTGTGAISSSDAAPGPSAPDAGDMAERLRALGYIGGEMEKSEPARPGSAPPRPAPDTLRRRKAARVAPAPAPATESVAQGAPDAEERSGREALGRPAPAPAAGVGEAGTRREDANGVAGGMVMMEVAPKDADARAMRSGAPPGRSLLVQFPEYTVSVFEDGTLVLSAGEYRCTARPQGEPVDPDITALFNLASVAGEGGAKAHEAQPADRPEVRLFERRAFAGRAPEAGTEVAAGAASEIGAHLESALRRRYLALMETRCGAVPRPVRSP